MQVQPKNYILIISGPSGVGKGTLLRMINKEIPNMWFSVSVTTRAPRKSEKDGVDYQFISNEAYEKLLKEDAFLERADVHTARYGTIAKPVYDALANQQIAVLDIDTAGAATVRAKHSDAVSVFILPPSWKELHRRLIERATETEEEVETRMRNARKEVKRIHEYDYVIVNDRAEATAEQLLSIVRAQEFRALGQSYTVPEEDE